MTRGPTRPGPASFWKEIRSLPHDDLFGKASGFSEVFSFANRSFSRLALSTGSEMTFPQLSSSGGTQEDTPLFNPQRSLATCHHLDGEQFGSNRVLT